MSFTRDGCGDVLICLPKRATDKDMIIGFAPASLSIPEVTDVMDTVEYLHQDRLDFLAQARNGKSLPQGNR